MAWTDQKARIAEIPEWVDRFLGISQTPNPTQITMRAILIDAISHWEESRSE